MMFIGSRHCPHCGAAATEPDAAQLSVLKCPRCKIDMASIKIGAEAMRECDRCGGLWVEVAAFERICANREQQSIVLGGASLVPGQQVSVGRVTSPIIREGSTDRVSRPTNRGPQARGPHRRNADGVEEGSPLGVVDREGSNRGSEPPKITYAPCPQCGQLMNRINFARCSGVVVDVCKGHGTWFDPDELREIVEFIRAGGLETSRQKEKREIEYEREQLRTEQMLSGPRSDLLGLYSSDEERISGLSAARGLLKFLIE